MTDEEQITEAWNKELSTLTQVMRAKFPDAPIHDVNQLATGVLLLSQLPLDEHLLAGVSMLRHDLERRGLATFVRMTVQTVGDVQLVEDEDKGLTSRHCGALFTASPDQTRKVGPSVYKRVLVELPGRWDRPAPAVEPTKVIDLPERSS